MPPNLEVVEGEKPLKASPDGTYAFPPGVHTVTFRKEGFHPATQEIDVSDGEEQVRGQARADHQVRRRRRAGDAGRCRIERRRQVATARRRRARRSSTRKDKPLKLAASATGFVTASRTLLAGRSSPSSATRCRSSWNAKSRGCRSRSLPSPVRNSMPTFNCRCDVLATRLGDDEPLEFVLVKPGKYSYGSSETSCARASCQARPSRSSSRSTSHSTKSPTPSTSNSPRPRATPRPARVGKSRPRNGPSR